MLANYLAGHFLGEPLHDWDVSRPARISGSRFPTVPAIIGTSGSTRRSATSARPISGASQHGEQGLTIGGGKASSRGEMHHFIGKDITYFHTLFWRRCFPELARTGACRRRCIYPRIFDRQAAKEIVKKQRARSLRATDLPGTSRSGVFAILLRLEIVVWPSMTST